MSGELVQSLCSLLGGLCYSILLFKRLLQIVTTDENLCQSHVMAFSGQDTRYGCR